MNGRKESSKVKSSFKKVRLEVFTVRDEFGERRPEGDCFCLVLVLMFKPICLSAQVYEVTIFEAEDEDSFDEDTEITEAVRKVYSIMQQHSLPHTHAHTSNCWGASLRIIGDASSATSWTPHSPETASAAGRCAVIGYQKRPPNLPRQVQRHCPRSQTAKQQPAKLQVGQNEDWLNKRWKV